MPLHYSRSDEWDIWPLVADAFLGILAVIIFLFAGQPIDREKEEFLKQVSERLEADKQSRDLLDFRIVDNRVLLIYSADRLSFPQCEWSLGEEPAEMLRGHLRLFTDKARLVLDITIDGHADRDSASNCARLVPYRDNVQLSQNRARAVFNVLLGLGSTQTSGLDELLWKPSEAKLPEGLEYLYDLARAGKIRVAGRGAAVPRQADPKDRENRRVELLLSLR